MWIVISLIILISLLYRPIWWNRAYIKIRFVMAFAFFYTICQVPSQESLVSFKEELNKIPKHVAFIFNERSYRPSSIADVITWFSSLGVETVTFYSQQAVEERMIHSIYSYLCKRQSGVSQIQNKITLASFENSKDSGDRNARRLEVIFIDKRYGKPMLTRLATKAMARSGDLTVDEFDKEVAQEVEFSAPELAIIFGPAFSTCGYPPWHLQFTEIHHFFSHKYLRWGQVQHVLKTFANTKQKYGK